MSKARLEDTSARAVAVSYKEQVSAQYRTVCAKTGEFFREVVNFGALLNEVEDFIGEGQGRDGRGLKAWLADNCPDVNYNTAAGYKAMAAKCAKMIGGGVQALACLQGRDTVVEPGTQDVVDVEASFIEKRDALFDQVDSRRQLEQMWFKFCGASKKIPKRPKTEFVMPTPEESAKIIWNEITLAMERSDAVNAIRDMPPEFASKYAELLERYAKMLRKRSRED